MIVSNEVETGSIFARRRFGGGREVELIETGGGQLYPGTWAASPRASSTSISSGSPASWPRQSRCLAM